MAAEDIITILLSKGAKNMDNQNEMYWALFIFTLGGVKRGTAKVTLRGWTYRGG